MILGKLTWGFGKSHETRKGWGTPAGLEKPGASLEKSWEAWRGMLQDDGGNLRRSREVSSGKPQLAKGSQGKPWEVWGRFRTHEEDSGNLGRPGDGYLENIHRKRNPA